MVDTQDLTVEQCRGAIAKAIKAADFTAAVDFLRYMAVRYPTEAAQVLATIELGFDLAERRDA